MEEPIKIVVIDDDPGIVEITQKILEEAGYKTFPAYTGREAIETVYAVRPDMILLDVNMPDVSGFEVCRRLKSDPTLEDMYVVIVSSTYTDGDSAAEGLSLGADGYIFRPVKNRELLERINALLRLQRIERQLKLANQEWMTTFDSVNDGLLLTDAEFTILKCNRETERLFGKSRKEILGRKCWEVTHGTEAPIEKCPFDTVRETLTRQSIVLEIGDRRFLVSVDPVVDGGGCFSGTVHVFSDVTEQLKLQEMLEERERTLATLIDNLRGMVYSCLNDEQWTMTFVSSGAFELTGYQPEELLGNAVVSYEELIHTDDRAMVRREIEAVLGKRKTFELEYRIIAKDGTVRHVFERGRGIWIDGVLHHLEGFITDITARVRAQEEILRREREFREIFNSTNEAIFIDDAATGRMLMVNDRGVELYGYDSAEELLAGNIGDLSADVPPFTEEEAQRRIRRAIEEGPQTFEWLAKKKNGEQFWVEVSLRRTDIGGLDRILAVVRDISDRKAAEEAMRRSEEQFRNMFTQHEAVMLMIDPEDGRIVDANFAAERFYGWPRETLLQMHIQQINTLTTEQVKEEMERARAGKKNYFNFRHRMADGSARDVEVYSSKIEISGKDYLFSIIHDITDRLRAEEALRLSEERFRKAFQVSPDAVNINRLSDGRFAMANDGFCAVSGYSRDEVIGKSSLELNIWADPTDRQRLAELLKRDGFVQNFQARFRMKDGSIRHGLMSAALIELDGEPHILNITRDITELVEAHEALRRSEQNWAALAEISPVGIFRTDAVGATVYVNPRWCEIAGITAEEAFGDGWLQAVHPDDRRLLIEGWKTAVKKKRQSFAEYRFLHADGSIRWVIGEAAVEKDENGRVIGYVGTITDITERKTAEKQLRYLNRLYNLLSQVNQAVVRAATPNELFQAVCSVAIEYGGFRFAWIGQLDEKSGRIAPVALAGVDEGYLQNIVKNITDKDCAGAPSVRAVKEGRPVITDILAAAPAPWRDEALKRGFLSAASTPIFRRGKRIGAACFYAAEEGFFNEENLRLLEEIGMDISFALDRMAAEEERQQAEKELFRSREMLRLIIDTIPIRVFWKDRESKYLGCNKLFALDAGREFPEELLGKTDYEMGWREQADLYRRDDRLVMENGVPKLGYEEPQTTPDGRLMWLRTSKLPLYDEAGRIVGVLGTYEDITEMKKAHEALAERERELRNLVEGMQEGVAQHELIYNDAGEAVDYVILDINPAFEKITGISRDRIVGRRASEAYGTGSAPYLQEYARTAASGRPVVFETFFPPMNKYFLISVFSPQPKRFVTVFTDISESKQHEAKLREKVEELERWQRAILGREERIMELKRQVNELLAELGRPPRYPSVEEA